MYMLMTIEMRWHSFKKLNKFVDLRNDFLLNFL